MSTVRVGLVSDSHGRFECLSRMADAAPDVAAWIHCGDYCDDGEDLAIYTGVPVYAVLGNNDYMTHTNDPDVAASPSAAFASSPSTAVSGMVNGAGRSSSNWAARTRRTSSPLAIRTAVLSRWTERCGSSIPAVSVCPGMAGRGRMPSYPSMTASLPTWPFTKSNGNSSRNG